MSFKLVLDIDTDENDFISTILSVKKKNTDKFPDMTDKEYVAWLATEMLNHYYKKAKTQSIYKQTPDVVSFKEQIK